MENTFTIPRFGNQKLMFRVGEYLHGGNTAVQIVSAESGEEYAAISVNVPGVQLPSGEFVFKSYSENEGLLPELLAASLVEVTGRVIDVGMAGPQLVCWLAKAN